ncbi:MAG TPA: tetratricopeptide repeat protein [Candidatus Acidoferrales bacterium]|nr:tetratricopeptide repeat protein [Candidatus Acidoferrales bacterium]
MYPSASRRFARFAAVLAATFALSIACAAQGASAVNSSRAPTVVVFPLENTGRNPQMDWLGEGLAELAAEQLTAAGVSVYAREDRLAVFEKLGIPSYAKFSRATMLKIGAEIDADYIIFGEFAPDGGTMRITAHLLGVSPARLSPAVVESGAITAFGEAQSRESARMVCLIHSGLSAGASCDSASANLLQTIKAAHLARPDAFEFYIRGIISSDDDARLRFLRQAAQLEPDWDQPLFAIGDFYYGKRDCEAAQQWLTRVAATSLRSAEANFDLGVCALQHNDPLKAEAVFTALASRARSTNASNSSAADDHPEVLSNLGAALLRQARYREALSHFERAQKIDPGEPDYDFNSALAHYLLNEWTPAVQLLRDALHLAPDDPTIKSLLAAALDRSGQTQEANALRTQSASDAEKPAGPRREVAKMDPTALSRLVRIRQDFGSGAGK